MAPVRSGLKGDRSEKAPHVLIDRNGIKKIKIKLKKKKKKDFFFFTFSSSSLTFNYYYYFRGCRVYVSK